MKTYTVECGCNARGTIYRVYVDGESDKNRYFSTKVKKSKQFPNGKKVLARTQLEEYTELLNNMGYNRVNTQIENEFEDFIAFGGKPEKFIENMPKNF